MRTADFLPERTQPSESSAHRHSEADSAYERRGMRNIFKCEIPLPTFLDITKPLSQIRNVTRLGLRRENAWYLGKSSFLISNHNASHQTQETDPPCDFCPMTMRIWRKAQVAARFTKHVSNLIPNPFQSLLPDSIVSPTEDLSRGNVIQAFVIDSGWVQQREHFSHHPSYRPYRIRQRLGKLQLETHLRRGMLHRQLGISFPIDPLNDLVPTQELVVHAVAVDAFAVKRQQRLDVSKVAEIGPSRREMHVWIRACVSHRSILSCGLLNV